MNKAEALRRRILEQRERGAAAAAEYQRVRAELWKVRYEAERRRSRRWHCVSGCYSWLHRWRRIL